MSEIDTSKIIDKVIAYNRDVIDVKCLSPNDIKTDITNSNNTITTKCIKYIKTLGELGDPNKDVCPIGSAKMESLNICVSSPYDSICDPGYDKINNKCYKPCNNNFITVDINKVNLYSPSDSGSKCINNNLIK
jgi:hypothetical protein